MSTGKDPHYFEILAIFGSLRGLLYEPPTYSKIRKSHRHEGSGGKSISKLK